MSYRPPTNQGGRPQSNAGQPMSRQGVGTRWGQQAAVGESVSRGGPEVVAHSTARAEGMKSSAGRGPGDGRRVQDRSYFMGVIRPRVTELTAEIERLRAEEERITKNSGTVLQMQQKQKTLGDEIAKLKSTLSDVNFAVEQSASGDPEQISGAALRLKNDNAEARRQVDKLFLQAKEAQTALKNQQKELEDELHRLDDKLRSSDQALYTQYARTRDDAYRVTDQVANMQQEIRAQDTKLDSLNLTLGKDPDKRRAAAMMLDILAKRQSRDEMARECSITIEEEKTQLIQQAKATSQDVQVLERQIVETTDAIQDTQKRLALLDDDLSEYSGDNARKFQELQEKDREMQEFIETFKDREREELKKIGDLEMLIQALLEHISRKQQLKAEMPKAGSAALQMDHMNSELGTREGQLAEAKQTYERLTKQLQEKKDDFDKVKFLAEKINGELHAISQRMEEQQLDITRFSDLEGLRREIEARKKHLSETRSRLTVQRDAAKQQLHLLSKQAEAIKAKLTEDQVYTSMQSQEQRLRVVWQATFALEDFVRGKEKETQYQGIKVDCVRMVDEIHVTLRDPARLSNIGGIPLM
jgi:intraflagellar transport protein 74